MNGWLLLLLLSWMAVGVAPTAGAEGRPVWGDWVVTGDDAEPGASVLRRIMPKSIFDVRTNVPRCPEGYEQDRHGACVKPINLNPQEHTKFLMERFKWKFPSSANSKKPQETGPFHINLPLASENPSKESVVNKRLPPPVVEVKTTLPSTTTTPQPQTTTWPTTTTMSDSTTTEVPSTTVAEPTEVTDTEKDIVSVTETTAEPRRDTTTETLNIEVMLGDQPHEGTGDESFDTPKSKENKSQLHEKPFLIIVTNPTVTRSETNPTFLPTEAEYETSTLEGNVKYTTEIPLITDKSFGEYRDVTETSIRPTVTIRPECEDQDASEDCEPVETEEILGSSSPSTLPELPLLDPSSQVRFPAESFLPVRKTQSFVRFPDVANPHEDRPAFWWPSWQIRQYPGIHGWPESSDQAFVASDRDVQRKYPYRTSWPGVTTWQRRFLQRD